MSTISTFSSRFKGGVRPNLFKAEITIPPSIGAMPQDFIFHCKGTSLPTSTIGNIDVNFLGRQLKVPGDRTFADWTVTVFNDENMNIRHTMEGWMASLQNHGANFQDSSNPTDVYGTGTVTQLARDGDAISTYSLSIYPTEVAAIDVAWESNDAVEEYTVTFAVNYWIPRRGGANFGTGGADDIQWNLGIGNNGITGNIGGRIGQLFGNFGFGQGGGGFPR
mgnify:CR=1 FL=1|tara:strand:+ start:1130 stop:1792 length:663 start_codon:yes stop_codon:yes gene_type:complete